MPCESLTAEARRLLHEALTTDGSHVVVSDLVQQLSQLHDAGPR
jgi:hypothetical protein